MVFVSSTHLSLGQMDQPVFAAQLINPGEQLSRAPGDQPVAFFQRTVAM